MSSASSRHMSMAPGTSVAQMTSSDNRKTNRPDTDDECLMANAAKRLKLNDTTFINGFTATEPSLLHDNYNIGWICALKEEMAAAKAMLEIKHKPLLKTKNDSNTYAFGSIGAHNVAICCLPAGHYGNNKAATAANNLRRTFPSMRLCLMVGIAGGVPDKFDVRLGDVVVGEGVLQHDIGKTVSAGNLERTGHVTRPLPELLTAVANLGADHEIRSSQIPVHLSEMLERNPYMTPYVNRDSLQDRLFDSAYEHPKSTERLTDECERCDASKLVERRPRDHQNAMIHYGIIASGNQVVKHGKTRHQLAYESNALCIEMEGAGVMDSFPGLVIRGICDYSDSHKNKQWQRIAAAVAAAYTKEFLLALAVDEDQIVPIIALPSANMGEYEPDSYRVVLLPNTDLQIVKKKYWRR